MNDDISFIDAEAQLGGKDSGVSFQSIVMRHYDRIMLMSAVDFTGGGWQERVRSSRSGGSMTEMYEENKGEAYYNAVLALHDLLSGYHDKDYLTFHNKWCACADKERKSWQMKQKTGQDVALVWRYVKVQQARKLFSELSRLLQRLNYFEGARFEDKS